MLDATSSTILNAQFGFHHVSIPTNKQAAVIGGWTLVFLVGKKKEWAGILTQGFTCW